MKQKLIPFLFLLLPLIFCPFIFNSSELAKVVFFRILILTLIGLFWLRIVTKFNDVFKHPKKNTISLLALGFLFWLLLTSLTGKYLPQSLFGNYFRQQGVFTFFHFIFLFFLVTSIRLNQKLLVYSISAGATLVSLYALFQAFPFFATGNFSSEITGSFGNPNFLSGYLVITLPFIFYLARKKKIFLFLLLPQSLAIFASGSRIAIFLLLLSSCFYLLHSLKKERLFPVLFVVFTLISLPLLKEISPTENRAKIWSKGFSAFTKRPILGWGLENFEFAFDSALFPPKDIGLTDIRVDKAHNEFLEILVASGVIGLGFYLTIVFLTLKKLWQKVKKEKNKEWWLALLISLSLFLIRSQFNPVSVTEQALFWLLIGLAVKKPTIKEKDFRFKNQKLWSALVVASLIFMIIFNLRSLWADYFFKRNLPEKAQQIFPWEEVYQIKTQENQARDKGD